MTSKCKHIYGLIHYVNTYRGSSKTSFEQEWGKPSDAQLGKDMYAQPCIVSEVFKVKTLEKKDTNKKGKVATVKAYELKYADVKLIHSPLSKILLIQSINRNKLFIQNLIKGIIMLVIIKSDFSESEACALSLINLSSSRVIYSPVTYVADDNLKKFYEEKINLSEKKISEICIETKDQSTCKEWFEVRSLRISASSKAHSIKTQSKKTCSALVTDFLSNQKKSTASLEYGLKHEKDAINEYIKQFGAVVKLVGVFVMPLQPWLCVSPDGLIIENDCIVKILEVKCPSSCQSKPIFDETTKKFNVPYLCFDNESVTLKTSHQYYTQCQMLMYATGVTECDLFVWSPKSSCVVNVHIDEAFVSRIIPKLKNFYFDYYLPALYDKNKDVDKENAPKINN